MKNLFIIPFFAALLVFGCSDVNNFDADRTQQSYQKIKMPEIDRTLSVEEVLTTSKRIVGNQGGSMELAGSYWTTEGLVTIEAELDFPDGCFLGAKVFTITNDGEYVEVDLGPSIGFVTAVNLDVTITGLDLTGEDPNEIDFLYFADDGTTEAVDYASLTVDITNGVLAVDDAQLQHFSRYGFVK